MPPPKLPSFKEQNPPPTLEVSNIFREAAKENEKVKLEDGIIQLDELKIFPSFAIVVEFNIGVLEATKEPREKNLVAIVTSNPKATKHDQKVHESNNPPTNTMVSREALMENMDRACPSNNPLANFYFDIVHSKSKLGVHKEKLDFKWNMSYCAQSKPTQKMGTTTN